MKQLPPGERLHLRFVALDEVSDVDADQFKRREILDRDTYCMMGVPAWMLKDAAFARVLDLELVDGVWQFPPD